MTVYDDSADGLASVVFERGDHSVVVMFGSGAGGETIAAVMHRGEI